MILCHLQEENLLTRYFPVFPKNIVTAMRAAAWKSKLNKKAPPPHTISTKMNGTATVRAILPSTIKAIFIPTFLGFFLVF